MLRALVTSLVLTSVLAPPPAVANQEARAAAKSSEGEALGLTEKDVTVLKLDNGMTFLLLDRDISPTVSTIIRFNVGSVDEKPGITGTSHLLEHMMFKGTTRMGTTNPRAEQKYLHEIDETVSAMREEQARLRAENPHPFWFDEDKELDSPRLEELRKKLSDLQDAEREYIVKNELWATYMENGGVRLNASTGDETTQYFVSLPANRLELWAFMESDRIANPVLREFYSERDVVKEERRLRTDTQPFGKLFEAFSSAAYMAHPYRWPVVGWMSDLDAVRRDQVLAYFRRYYAPNNAVAALVGDMDIPETTRMIKRYFGVIPSQPAPDAVATQEPQQHGERRVEVLFDANPYLAIGWHIPDYTHPDTPALEMLGRILSRGKTSRFYQSLIRDQQLALFVSGRAESSKYPGMLVVFGAPRHPHDVAELEAGIYAEIAKIQKDGVDEWELEKLRNQEDAGFVRQLSSNFGLASQLSYYQLRYGDWTEMLRRRKVLAAVTAEDVKRVANTYLKPENRTVAWLARPKEGESAAAGGGMEGPRPGMWDPSTLPYPLNRLLEDAVWADDVAPVSPAQGGSR